jgi:hypothetical protein
MRTIIIEKVIHEKMDSKIPESDREGQSLNALHEISQRIPRQIFLGFLGGSPGTVIAIVTSVELYFEWGRYCHSSFYRQLPQCTQKRGLRPKQPLVDRMRTC